MDKLDDRIIKELQEIAEKFANDEYILDQDVIENNIHLRHDAFAMKFIYALNNFRLSKPNDMHYNYNCKEFHDVVIEAKTCNAIIDKNALKELREYKQRCIEFEGKLREANLKIELLTEEKGILKGKLEVYERDFPKSDTLTGDVSD